MITRFPKYSANSYAGVCFFVQLPKGKCRYASNDSNDSTASNECKEKRTPQRAFWLATSERLLENLKAILTDAGLTLTHVVKIKVFLNASYRASGMS